MRIVTADDLWTMGQTAFGEARGEGVEGIRAVCHVIYNRATIHPRWRNQSIAAICRAPWQFSCWMLSDPNRGLLNTLSLPQAEFALCLTEAVAVLNGAPDITSGATHYYAPQGAKEPLWARGHTPTCTIGHHVFYAGIA